MKRFKQKITIALAALSLIHQSFALEPSREGPAVHLADQTHNFGKALIGDVVQHSFILTNVGTEPVKILSIKHSCGCTTAGYDQEIAPGKTGKVTLELNTQGLDGKIQKTVSVTTNDPRNAKMDLMFLCEVWSEIKVGPDFAIFHPGGAKEDKRVILITNQIAKPLEIGSIHCADSRFEISLRAVKEGKIYELIIVANPSELKEMVHTSVSFRTSCERTPLVTIPILVVPLQPSKSE